MYLRFKSLRLINFMSFEDSFIDFECGGYTLIRGENNNKSDSAKSNGSGKSSIWEAVSWAITGETIRGTKEVKRLGVDEKTPCSVTVVFSVDNVTYEITRSKDPTSLKLIINGEDKSGKGIRDTQQILSSYLPDLTSNLIGSVIILGQGLPQRFTNNTPSGRKECLEKLSKSDFMIEDLKSKISERKNKIADAKRQYENSILSSESKKSVIESALDKNRFDLDNFPDKDKLRDEINLCKVRYSEVDSEFSLLDKKITALSEELEQLNATLNNNSKEMSSTLLTLEDEKSNSLREIEEKSNYSSKKTECALLENEIKKLSSVVDVCPTCGQKLPVVLKVDTSDKKRLLEEYKDSLKQVDSQLALINETYSAKKNEILSSSKQEEAKLQKEIKEKKDVLKYEKENLLNLTAQKRQLEAAAVSKEEQLKNLESRYAELEKAKKELEEELNTHLKNIKKFQGALESAEEHLDIVNKFYTIATRDFRGILLNNIISYINNKAKDYCEYLFGSRLISFEQDGNNISISYDKKQYESLSGGEKQKVDIIVQFSLRDMLCEYLDFSSNMLVLDEITDNIDSDGVERLFGLLSKNLLDVESVFLISHRTDFELPVDREWLVEKNQDGVSSIHVL